MAKFIFALLVTPISVLLHGYVISTLWGWFIVSKFDIVTISVLEGMAIALVAGVMSGYGYNYPILKDTVHEQFDQANLTELIGYHIKVLILSFGLPLGFGWVLLQVMTHLS